MEFTLSNIKDHLDKMIDATDETNLDKAKPAISKQIELLVELSRLKGMKEGILNSADKVFPERNYKSMIELKRVNSMIRELGEKYSK